MGRLRRRRPSRCCARRRSDDGYLNTWIQGVQPERRWQELEESHELYCLGHLIQARRRRGARRGPRRPARGRAPLRRPRRRALRRGGRRAGPRRPPRDRDGAGRALPPHRRRALPGARQRAWSSGAGAACSHGAHFGSQYLQDHLPVREATEPIGHAVRQLYLAAGVTDVYLETGDDVAARGDGGRCGERTCHGEDVRHRRASARATATRRSAIPTSCRRTAPTARRARRSPASMWNWRMLLATADGRYADEMERALYNAIAVSTSLDGCHFTYSNPLHLRAGHDGSHEDAPSERLPWFTLRVLPAEPRAARRVAAPLRRHARRRRRPAAPARGRPRRGAVPGGRPSLDVSTDYPWDGRVEIAVEGPASEWTLSLRVPAWCEGATLTVDGESGPARRPTSTATCALRRAWDGRHAGRARAADAGAGDRAAPARRRRARLRRARPRPARLLHRAGRPPGGRRGRGPAARPRRAAAGGRRQRRARRARDARRPGAVEAPARGRSCTASSTPPRARPAPATLTAIPYFRWANRGPNAMRVWIPTA